MRLTLLTVALLIYVLAPKQLVAADVYKCVENGVTKFSALPCSGKATQSNYDVNKSESITEYWRKQQVKQQEQLKERLERAEKYISISPWLSEDIKNAIRECRITQGMTRKQVYLSWNVLPVAEKKQVSRESSLTFYTYDRTPICRKDKFKEADLTFNNRTRLLVGWNIRS